MIRKVKSPGPVSDSSPKPPRRRSGAVPLRDLFARRVKKPAKPKEIVLHMVVAKLLRDHCLPGWRWTHMPSGEARDVRTAKKLKAMGVNRGWPDFILADGLGALHFLELKRLGGKLTEEQKDFKIWCIRGGIPYAVAVSLQDALTAFDVWGCLRVKVGGVHVESEKPAAKGARPKG